MDHGKSQLDFSGEAEGEKQEATIRNSFHTELWNIKERIWLFNELVLGTIIVFSGPSLELSSSISLSLSEFRAGSKYLFILYLWRSFLDVVLKQLFLKAEDTFNTLENHHHTLLPLINIINRNS